MKRIFTLLFAAMLAGQAWAQTTFTVNNLEYTVIEGTTNVTIGTTGEELPADLVILSEVTNGGVTYTVTGFSEFAFQNCNYLKTVAIPNTFTSIGEFAFQKCHSLESVDIPNSVTIIGERAFEQCEKLASVTLPDHLTEICNLAFDNCTGLTNLIIPISVTTISSNAFYRCSNISFYCEVEEESIPEGWGNNWDHSRPIVWGYNANPQTWTVTLSSNNNAYGTVSGGGTVANGSTTTITASPASGYKFVKWSNGLTTATATLTVTTNLTIEAEFAEIGSLQTWTVTLSTNDDTYGTVSGGGTVANGSTATITATPAEGYEFLRWSNELTTATATITVTSDTSILAVFALGTMEPSMLLYENTSDSTVKVIHSNDYWHFSSIVIPNTTIIDGKVYSVTSISDYAFRNCRNLLSVAIPNTVTSIGENAFHGCDYLTDINVESGNTKYSSEDGILFNCDKTTLVRYPYNKIGAYTIPESVSTIGQWAFSLCEQLTSFVIPNSVERIEYGAFEECSNLASISISEGVSYIGGYAFEKCSSLTTVSIPNSVTDIMYNTFEDCTNLTTISLPNTITDVDDTAFDGCDKLEYNEYDNGLYLGNTESPYLVLIKAKSTDITSCEINDKCKVIASGAFSGCSELTSITVPNSVQSIGCGAFFGCSSLQSMTLPFVGDRRHSYTDSDQYPFGYIFGYGEYEGSIETWQSYYNVDNTNNISSTFYIPSSLKSVTLTDCDYIQYGAFRGCDNITSITIPTSITHIDDYAFNNYDDNLTIYCDLKSAPRGWNAYPYNVVWGTVDVVDSSNVDAAGFAYKIIDGTSVEIIDYLGSEKEIVIPSTFTKNGVEYTVTRIGDNAFRAYYDMESITIPNTVTSIGTKSFYLCHGITSLTIPNSVTSIGSCAFENCGGLTSVEIPNSVTSIGNSAFSLCYNLESVTIPNSVKNISNKLFSSCDKLSSVSIPNSVTSIGNDAFSKCGKLTSINIPNSVTYIGESAFILSGLTNISIPNSVTYIDWSAFRYCSNLTLITIPKSVEKMDMYVFDDCPNVTIYCEAEKQPEGWVEGWNSDNCPVVWGSNINKIFYVALSANNYEYGSVEGGGVSVGSSMMNIVATPTEGCRFVKWSNGLTNATETITVISDTTLVAEFELIKWNVAVSTNNNAYGNVNGGGTVTDGSKVTITATPANSCRFVKWNNGLTNTSETITVSSDTTIVAEFEYIIYRKVTISSNNDYYGFVDGSGTVEDGKTVTITATPESGHHFVKWSNGLTTDTATITVTSDTTLVAEFEKDITWNINLSANNSAYGTVEGGCNVADGTTVTIIATPAVGCKFVKWSNGLTTDTATITVTSDTTIVAEFAEILYAGYCGTDARWRYNMLSQTITISGTGSIDKYKTVGSIFTTLTSNTPWSEIANNIKHVVVDEGITDMGSRAFWGCENLETVKLPSTCTSYGGLTFAECPKLKEVVVAATTVWQVDEYCFSNYDSCTLCVPAGYVDYYKKNTVFGLFSKIVGAYMVTVDANIKNGTVEVESYTIPEGGKATVTPKPDEGYSVIDVNFEGNYGSRIIYNGYIYAVDDVRSNIYVSVEFGRESESSFTYRIIDGTNVEITAYNGTDSVIAIPSTITDNGVEYTVTSIGDRAFDGNSDIKSVTIPNTVTNIGESAFSYPDLTSLTVPNSVKTIGEYAFSDVKNVVYNGSASGSPWGALTINGTVDGNYVFADAEKTHLTAYINPTNEMENTIEIPETVVSIGPNAILNVWAKQYGDAYYWGNEENPYLILWKVGSLTGDDDNDITSFEVHEGCKYIYASAFAYLNELESVTISNSVVSINQWAFVGCNNLTSVTIPGSVKYIGEGAFWGCEKLRSVIISDGVETIGNDAFGKCVQLSSVSIAGSVKTIGDRAFTDCPNLSSLTISDGVEKIGEGAFCNCRHLESLNIPKSVTEIGERAFDDCYRLTIYSDATEWPAGWLFSESEVSEVIFKTTAVAESAANAVNIYAYGNTIVVENATDEISVYDAMGRLIVETPHCDVSTGIRVNTAGVYIVKVGNAAKRVVVNDK